MARKNKPEDIIGKLRKAEIVLAQGGTARPMKELEKETARLRRAVSDLALDKLIQQEAARGNL